MTVKILHGDCVEVLRTLPEKSVQCCLTSPPYWSLRNYGIEPSIWGGDPNCGHEWGDDVVDRSRETPGGQDSSGLTNGGAAQFAGARFEMRSAFCLRCGAWKGALGLEPEPSQYIENMVAVFREVRRVLKDDGILWLNLGDCYAGSGRGGNPTEATSTQQGSQETQRQSMAKRARSTKEVGSTQRTAAVTNDARRATRGSQLPAWVPPPTGLKTKDLIGLPWLVAFALRSDGWYLRQWLPWVKRNGVPESVTDRPSVSVETIFLLSKSERYWYDHEAVRRQASASTHARVSQDIAAQAGSLRANGGAKTNGPMKAVIRRPKRAEPGTGIRANDSFENATCHEVLEDRNLRNADLFFDSLQAPHGLISDETGDPLAIDATTQPFKEAHFATFPPNLIVPLIKAGCPDGGVVLDPFGGSGTVGLVAARLKRDAVLIERNPEYVEMARRRISGDAPLLGEVA